LFGESGGRKALRFSFLVYGIIKPSTIPALALHWRYL